MLLHRTAAPCSGNSSMPRRIAGYIMEFCDVYPVSILSHTTRTPLPCPLAILGFAHLPVRKNTAPHRTWPPIEKRSLYMSAPLSVLHEQSFCPSQRVGFALCAIRSVDRLPADSQYVLAYWSCSPLASSITHVGPMIVFVLFLRCGTQHIAVDDSPGPRTSCSRRRGLERGRTQSLAGHTRHTPDSRQGTSDDSAATVCCCTTRSARDVPLHSRSYTAPCVQHSTLAPPGLRWGRYEPCMDVRPYVALTDSRKAVSRL